MENNVLGNSGVSVLNTETQETGKNYQPMMPLVNKRRHPKTDRGEMVSNGSGGGGLTPVKQQPPPPSAGGQGLTR